MDGTLRGDRLRLRFVTRAEAPLLRNRYAPDPGGFNDFDDDAPSRDGSGGSGAGPAPGEGPAPEGELRSDHDGVLWVERLEGGDPIGTVQYHRVAYGPNPESSAWMIGIDLLPEARGRGYGADAQRLLADWLFATTRVNRVEAQTDVDNAAEARSLEKAGFTRDGIVRGAQFRRGTYHDLIVYSRLRSDPG